MGKHKRFGPQSFQASPKDGSVQRDLQAWFTHRRLMGPASVASNYLQPVSLEAGFALRAMCLGKKCSCDSFMWWPHRCALCAANVRQSLLRSVFRHLLQNMVMCRLYVEQIRSEHLGHHQGYIEPVISPNMIFCMRFTPEFN